MTTVTSNLKLRLSENLTSDARYNLERIDQVGSIVQLDDAQAAVLRSQTDISIRPNDASKSGSGTGGTIRLGDISQRLSAVVVNGPISLLNKSTSNNFLTSILIDNQSQSQNRTLEIQLANTDFLLKLPITNDEVAAAAAISGSKISPIFTGLVASGPQGFRIDGGPWNTNLLPGNSQSADVNLRLPIADGSAAQVLTTDGAGNLSFSSPGAGTVTSVALALPNIFTVTGSPVALSGTLTATLNPQAASLVLSGPAVGNPAAAPVFRQLSADDLIDGTTNKFYSDSLFATSLLSRTTTNLAEGASLYHTSLRAQDAAGAILLDTPSINLSYSSGVSVSADVLPAGVNHDALLNYVADQHVAHASVSILTPVTSGLSGGGDITASRTLVIDPVLATLKSGAHPNDVVLIADSNAGNVLKKISLSDIVNLSGGSYVTNWTTGLTLAVSHGLASEDVLVEVFDNVTKETILLDSVVRTDTNTVTLTTSVSPSGAGLRVLIKRI